jgi:hypothetical protein
LTLGRLRPTVDVMTASRRSTLALAACLASSLVLAACTTGPEPRIRPRAPEELRGGLAEEAEEQAEKTELRLDALEQARSAGTLGVIGTIRRAPAPGWAGETVMNETSDDWEPAIAADPNEPYVYVLHNRYGGEPACRDCPDPAMILHVSRDGGRTWRHERYLCPCRGVRGQYDPLIEVVPQTGDVYAVWMNNFKIHFSSSIDHGRNWSEPVLIHPNVRWGDKPNMAVSEDGQDIYVLFNGPSAGDVHAASSHDGGRTWTSLRVSDSDRYYYNYGGAVLPDGRAISTQISFTYSGPGDEAEGVVRVHVIASDDGGSTWSDLVVDELQLGTECASRGCYRDFYDSGPAVASDADGDLVIVYSGAARPGGPRTVYARSSVDGGITWSERTRLSRAGVNAAFAAAAGVGDDEVRVFFADQRTGVWNVRYRTSTDLGTTWSKAVRISDAFSGTAYKTRRGFAEFYGDYGEIAVTNRGRTVAVWGEGSSYVGPGGVWFNRER